MSPRFRLYMAWVMFVGSIVGYPVTAFGVARDEPAVVLFLSWLAIWLTSIDILSTTDVRVRQEETP